MSHVDDKIVTDILDIFYTFQKVNGFIIYFKVYLHE